MIVVNNSIVKETDIVTWQSKLIRCDIFDCYMLFCSVKHKLYSFFNISDSWSWVGNATPRPPDPRERDPVPIV